MLDLFAGAGGAALGLHGEGFEHVACVERDPSAVATLRAAGFPAVEADVRDLDYAALAGTIDVLWASPPCQAWSTANQHAARKGADDVARNGWPWTLRVVRAIRPRWAIFENVRNAVRYVERHVVPELRRLFPHVAVWTLNAADHGVPQSRTRLFVIAGPRPVSAPATEPRRSMRSAIGVAWDSPSPCVMTNEWKGRPTDPAWWRKLNNASDALAIATNGARRKLTLGECAALQTFPVGYPFAGGVEARYRQVGNAVPPVFAAAVARAIRAAEEGVGTVRESLPAVGALAERVLGRAVALVRARPPRGVGPEEIDQFVVRHLGRLRATVADTLQQRAA
ncbi:MAG: DNA cytosine methyltransferase [Myxococcota bacterium]